MFHLSVAQYNLRENEKKKKMKMYLYINPNERRKLSSSSRATNELHSLLYTSSDVAYQPR